MPYRIILVLLVLISGRAQAQELFVSTEPASNMAAKSIGVRIGNQVRFSPDFEIRTTPEVMIGFNKRLMGHVQGFFSDADGGYRYEGGSVYAKYRFLSIDGVKTHSRAAAFGRVSYSKREAISEDINLEGDNSGFKGGLIFTQLLHKLALSGTVSYAKAFDVDARRAILGPVPNQMIGYSLSSGYLLLPFQYKSYTQPNFNLYLEVLGNANPDTGHGYLDFAPAVQVIINSVTRIDLSYRFQVSGDMINRYNKNMYMAKVEFNFFNVLK
jgi:hypothetical protein